MNDKIAVLLAGPSRYINSTIKSIFNVYGEENVHLYIYLWKSDAGNKKRSQEQEFLLERVNNNNIRFFAFAEPELPYNYNKIFSKEAETGQSVASNIIGMFNSMRILVNQVDTSTIDYKLVIRLRTDCAIISQNFFSLDDIRSNEVYTSKNFLIPHDWVSDHIMAGSKEAMLKVWGWSDARELYRDYVRCGMNPEKLLAFKLRKQRILSIERWMRYDDYHIVYNPPKEGDPRIYNDFLNNNSIDSFFNNVKSLRVKGNNEIDLMISKQKANQDYYANPRIVKATIIMKRKTKDLFLRLKARI